MIPEPQRTYVLELLAALGSAADGFIVAGAQAMKFTVAQARGTKDVDFVLNVVALRNQTLQLANVLASLGYIPVPESRNFQFVKTIPNSAEVMRIEFMAPEEFKRPNNIRVDIQKGVHARACTGGSIALIQSDLHTLSGNLPDGTPFSGQIRVTRPHALVMLKLLALADRYNNLRGPKEARHDREEAQTHASDIVSIVTATMDISSFKELFIAQFQQDPTLGIHVLRLLPAFFRDLTSPGLIVYSEHIAADLSPERATTELVRSETERAHQSILRLFPPPEFFAIAAAVDDSTNHAEGAPLAEQYLSTLEQARIPIADPLALQFLPSGAFGGAYARGGTFVVSASEPIAKLSEVQRAHLRAYLQAKLELLRPSEDLRSKYPHIFSV